MDKSMAERLGAELDAARAEFRERAEAERWDFVEAAHGFTGPIEHPTGLLVSMGETKKAGRRYWIVGFTKSAEGYAFADRENWQEVIPSIVTKAEAVAARLRQEKSAATKETVKITTDPKPNISVAVSVEEIQQGYTARRKAEAAAYDKHLDAEIEKRQREREAAVNAPDPFRTSPQEPRTPDSEQTVTKIHERRMKRERGE